eukprot:403373127
MGTWKKSFLPSRQPTTVKISELLNSRGSQLENPQNKELNFHGAMDTYIQTKRFKVQPATQEINDTVNNKLGIISDPRKFYLDVGVIRNKSRNASRSIQQRISADNDMNIQPTFKVSTSPTTLLFEDLQKNRTNYQHKAVVASREHEMKQLKFHKEKLICQILKKYQSKDFNKEKLMKQGSLTARQIADRLEKRDYEQNLQKISRKIKLQDMQEISLMKTVNLNKDKHNQDYEVKIDQSDIFIQTNTSTKPTALNTDRSLLKQSSGSTLANLDLNNIRCRSRQQHSNQALMRNNSDAKLRNIMTSCMQQRRQIKNINCDIRNMERNILTTDNLIKVLDTQDEVELQNDDLDLL